MIVALWHGRNRRRASVGIKSLRWGPPGIFRYRLIGGHLLGYAALRLAFRQRRHRRIGSAGRDRWLGGLVAAAETDIGEALQQRHPHLLRMLFVLGFTA